MHDFRYSPDKSSFVTQFFTQRLMVEQLTAVEKNDDAIAEKRDKKEENNCKSIDAASTIT
jgi:hypothetical protein